MTLPILEEALEGLGFVMSPALFHLSVVLLARPAVARPKEVPQQQTQNGQQHYGDCPDQFFLVGYRALENVENGPNVPSEHQHANESVVSKVHHSRFLLLAAQVVNA